MTAQGKRTARPGTGLIVAVAAVMLASGIGYRLVTGGPSTADSVEVLCALRNGESAPLVDTTGSNSRDDLAAALRDRADELERAASRTSGAIEEALSGYAAAMTELADSLQSDVSGAALGDAVERLAADPDLAAAEKTLNEILDKRC